MGMKTKAHNAIVDIPLFAEKNWTWCFSSTAFSVRGIQNVTVNTTQILNYLKKGVRFSHLKQMLRRNLNQNGFAGVSSDKGFLQQSWLLIDGGRKKNNCYTCPSRKTWQANLATVSREKKNSWQPLITTTRETKLDILKSREYVQGARGAGDWQVDLL